MSAGHLDHMRKVCRQILGILTISRATQIIKVLLLPIFSVILALKESDFKTLEIEIFAGTWTQRNVVGKHTHTHDVGGGVERIFGVRRINAKP